MMKWPVWIRVVVGTAIFLVSLALAFFLEAFLGDYSQFITLLGAAAFIYLNPELMRGD
ncbi:hypothetical protein [uncultured Flavonifractor sp.]|uniref:hypothetical protein n=1 Tax=uncultured Flavonifractor sp. TaxID=1193534 RepID=UPI002616F6C7|nr:hypothetical protein [uncultured Flavonifractor sp.]